MSEIEELVNRIAELRARRMAPSEMRSFGDVMERRSLTAKIVALERKLAEARRRAHEGGDRRS